MNDASAKNTTPEVERVTIKSVEEIEAYTGPHAIAGIRFRHARQDLGVSSWGMNVLELDPGCDDYPEHDHEADGHEEVYVVLKGTVVLVVDGQEHALAEGTFARVPGALRRKLVTRETSATVLALGGTPGAAYKSTLGS